MDFETQGRLSIPGFDEPVLLYDDGERRMGAYLIVITTPCLIGGVSRFVTINGSVYYSSLTNSLIIHDACTIFDFIYQQNDSSILAVRRIGILPK